MAVIHASSMTYIVTIRERWDTSAIKYVCRFNVYHKTARPFAAGGMLLQQISLCNQYLLFTVC